MSVIENLSPRHDFVNVVSNASWTTLGACSQLSFDLLHKSSCLDKLVVVKHVDLLFHLVDDRDTAGVASLDLGELVVNNEFPKESGDELCSWGASVNNLVR